MNERKTYRCPRCGTVLTELRPNRHICQSCTAGYARLVIWTRETLELYEHEAKSAAAA